MPDRNTVIHGVPVKVHSEIVRYHSRGAEDSNLLGCSGPHTLFSLTVQFNCVKKTARKTELNVLWHSTGFPSGRSFFFFLKVVFLRV